jgi:gluconokinase
MILCKEYSNEDFTTTENFESFINEAFEIPPGCEGLIFLPYIYGERAPVWDANARGIFYGVSSIHNRAHFMRAILEGVSFGLYSIFNSLEEIAGPVKNIYASGGFIRSKKWVSLIADVFGKKLFVSQAEDSSAAGAAIIGLKALGKIKDLMEPRSFFSEVESFEADMEKHQVYQLNYAVYSTLYEKFKEIKQ